MAELLESTGEFRDTPNRRYPWAEWLDGRARRLDPMTDFSTEPRVLRTYIYAMARKRGLKVVIAIEPTDHIVLQSYDPATQRRPLLPSPYRRLPNGKLDRTAPNKGATTSEGTPCSVCGKRLTPAGMPSGQCAKFDPTHPGNFRPVHVDI